MFKNILTFINENNLYNYLVYFTIALLMLLGIFKCIFPVLNNSRLLNRAVRRLERGINKGDRPIWQEPQFLGRPLQLHWQKFLLNAQHLDIRGIPCNANDYINDETIIYIPGHSQFGDMLPTLFTSLGILGTFIGLMQGLGNLDISNAEKTIQSIPILLGSMKYAFTTSIVGISCSLIFNMVNRIVIGHAYQSLDRFDEAFYELAMPRPLDPTVQLICQNQDSTAIIKHSSNSLRTSLTEAIENSLMQTLVPVANSMDNFINVSTSHQIDGVDKIVMKFVNHMDSSLNNQFKSLADTLSLVNKTNVLSFDSLQKNVEAADIISQNILKINSASKNIVKLIDEYIVKERNALGTADESFKNAIIDTLETIKSNNLNQNEFLKNLKEYRNLLQKDYRQYIDKSSEIARSLADNNSNNTQIIKASAKEAEESMQNIVKTYINSAEQISKELKTTMESFNKDFAKLSEIVKKVSDDVQTDS